MRFFSVICSNNNQLDMKKGTVLHILLLVLLMATTVQKVCQPGSTLNNKDCISCQQIDNALSSTVYNFKIKQYECQCQIDFAWNYRQLNCQKLEYKNLNYTASRFNSSTTRILVICSAGSYANEFAICAPCNIACSSCTGPSNTQCIECSNGYYLNNNATCLQCNVACGTCTGPAVQNCLTCNIGYFLSNSSICTQCNVACAHCSGTLLSNCIDCASHYFNSSHTCTQCNIACLTCSGTLASNCLVCAYGYYNSGGTTCSICNPVCTSCTGSTTSLCSSCIQGYYHHDTSICSQCNVACATCNGAASSNCLTCNFGYVKLDQTTCIPCHISCLSCTGPAKTQCQTCAVGFYQHSSTSCLVCVEPCQTCTGPLASNCLTCITGYVMALDGVTCLSSCPSGQYISASLSCVSCTGVLVGNADTQNKCLSCVTRAAWYGAACHVCPSQTVVSADGHSCQACQVSQFWNAGTLTCDACHPFCYICTGSLSSECTQCSEGYGLSVNTCNLCAAGTFWTDRTTDCTPCDAECATCSGTSSNCMSCISGYNLYGSSCKCSSPTYQNQLKVCLQCSIIPTGLSSPISSVQGNCVCNGVKHFEWNPLLLKCICKTLYYLKSTTCTLCSSLVQSTLLDLESTNGVCHCDQSKNFEWSISLTKCVCMTGYLLSQNGQFCTACTTGTTCCPSGSNKVYNSVTRKCQCMNGFYSPSSLSTAACVDCATLTVGTVVPVTSKGGVCDCNINNNFVWSPSARKCDCSSTDNFVLNANDICVCKATYYLTQLKKCARCTSSLLGVVGTVDSGNENECKCDITKFFTWNIPLAKCVCQIGYYLKSNKCISCTGMTLTSVTVYPQINACSCDPTQNAVWKATKFQCYCKDKYYLNTTGFCVTCDITGSQKDKATPAQACICNSIAHFYWDLTIRLCICQNPYYLNGVSCVTCVGKTLSMSTSKSGKCNCKDKAVWNTTTLSCNCIQGYYYSLSKCNSCATMVGTVSPPKTLDNNCVCDIYSNFEWNPTLKNCRCQLNYIYSNGNCISCYSISGVSVSSQTHGQCICDATLQYMWESTLKTCICSNSFYSNLEGICTDCSGMDGVVTTTPKGRLGQCLCRTNNYFEWSSQKRMCVCKDKYFRKNHACTSCSTLTVGLNSPISSVNEVCTCKTAGYFEWSTSSFTCVCMSQYYYVSTTRSCKPCSLVLGNDPSIVTNGRNCECQQGTWNTTLNICKCQPGQAMSSAGICVYCTGPAGYSNTNSNGIICNCLSARNFAWDINSGSCKCKTNYYRTNETIPNCKICTSATGSLSTATDQKCNCVIGFQWNDATRKCYCPPQFLLLGSKCIDCTAMSGSNGNIVSSRCSCTTPDFTWSASFSKCICSSTKFISDSTTCSPCTGHGGVLSTATSNGIICNCKSNFIWDATAQLCKCKNDYYLKNGVCANCPNSPGYLPGSTDQICNCQSSYYWNTTHYQCLRSVTINAQSGQLIQCDDNYALVWSNLTDTQQCQCLPPFTLINQQCNCLLPYRLLDSQCICQNNYIYSRGECILCSTIPYASYDESNVTACVCLTGLEWSKQNVCDCGPFSAMIIVGSQFTCQMCDSSINAERKLSSSKCVCSDSFIWNGQSCVCPDKTVYSEQSDSCI